MYFFNFFIFLVWPLSIPIPSYGWYRADSNYWNRESNILLSGNGNHAFTSGAISLSESSGDGAMVELQYLYGETESTVEWPTGSIPSEFTICSITRYVVDGRKGRILAGRSSPWLHGHYESKRGVAYYKAWNTDMKSVGVLTDWLVICGKNSVGLVPNNILVDGVALGVINGGGGGGYLGINNNLFSPAENSHWAFRELMIWNTTLSDEEMRIASMSLRISLIYGQVYNIPYHL